MKLISSKLKSLVAAVTLILCTVSLSSNCCEVDVAEPWERVIYVPNGSSMQLNCTVSRSEQSQIWSIILAGRDTTSQFGFQQSIELLNSYGFYTLSVGSGDAIRLLMNSTERNNGTVIRCDDISTPSLLQETTIIVYDPVPVTLSVNDNVAQEHSIDISWTSETSPSVGQKYTLMVSSDNTQPQTFQTSVAYFHFTAPDLNAPPCEVYNFSVTATPVGATYTGYGCSAPSPVLSRMLPSLPDISVLDSSLNYSLSKGSTGITLDVSYQPPVFCDLYPPINYTLVINGPDRELNVTSTTNQIRAIGLSENRLYKFKIFVFNSFGSAVSKEIQIYTTDVQSIVVNELQADINVPHVNIQCHFIASSNAQGCMVVLTGEDGSMTLNLLKRHNHSAVSAVFKANKSLSCYHKVEAFDIESDGTVGTIAVPGNLQGTAMPQCYSAINTVSGSAMLNLHNGWFLVTLMLCVYLNHHFYR